MAWQSVRLHRCVDSEAASRHRSGSIFRTSRPARQIRLPKRTMMPNDFQNLADPLKEANEPSSPVARFGSEAPLLMDCGVVLEHWQIAYQTYGVLNADKSNAILVCHALTGDQHVASRNPITGKGGWWTAMIGPGKPIDTDRFF